MAAAAGIQRNEVKAVGIALADKRKNDEAMVEGLDKAAEQVALRSRSALSSRPGGGSYQRNPSDISSESLPDGGAIAIARGGTTVAAEYGAKFHYVFGNRVEASSMGRRVFPKRGAKSGRGIAGYVVGATINKNVDAITGEVVSQVLRDMARRMRQAGARVSKKGF